MKHSSFTELTSFVGRGAAHFVRVASMAGLTSLAGLGASHLLRRALRRREPPRRGAPSPTLSDAARVMGRAAQAPAVVHRSSEAASQTS